MTKRNRFAWDRYLNSTSAHGLSRATCALALSIGPAALASGCTTDPARADVTGSASEALFAVSISGVVTSAQGPIVGATVKLGGSVAETAVSGPGGAYTFSNLPLNGSYQVSVAPMTNCSCGSAIELWYLRHSVSGEDFTMMGSGCGGAAGEGGASDASVLQCNECPAGPQGAAGPQGPAGPPSKIDSLIGDAAALPQLANATSAANFCVVGQILLFPFTPQSTGLLAANGQLLPIATNVTLFSLFGTTFGGDGVTTFALPNLTAVAPNNTGYFVCASGVFP
jgi:hypothetical protein